MDNRLEAYDFLESGKDDRSERLRKRIENILDSYSYFSDILAEILQNAADAIDSKYLQNPNQAIAKIHIDFDILNRRICVQDTGVGMPWHIMREAPSPDVSHKNKSYSHGNEARIRRSRGEKGVGLSFLTFVCNGLRIQSCDGKQTVEAVVDNGFNWYSGETDEIPVMRPTSEYADEASQVAGSDTYTLVELLDVKTLEYSDRDIFETSLPELEHIIRTKTAIGNTTELIRSTPPEPDIDVILHYYSSDGKKTERSIPYRYLSPAEYIGEGSKITYDDFQELMKKDKAHRAGGKALIYINAHETAGQRPIECYAFSMAPSAFDELTRDSELETGWAPDSWSGIYIATRAMPTGIRLEPPATGTAGYWRRIFMLLQDDEMSFDVGRKSLRGKAVPMMKEISKTIWDDIEPYLQKLTPGDSEAVTRLKAGKRLQLFAQALAWNDLGLSKVQYAKEPQREQMVVALFYELVGAKLLTGYETLRNNTIDQYDAFIRYYIPKDAIGKIEAANMPGTHIDDQIIVEFKHKASKIISDIRAKKKSYQDINLLVCWEVDEKALKRNQVDVEAIPPDSVYYYGSTHILYFPGTLQAGENLHTIELKSLISTIRANLEVTDS